MVPEGVVVGVESVTGASSEPPTVPSPGVDGVSSGSSSCGEFLSPGARDGGDRVLESTSEDVVSVDDETGGSPPGPPLEHPATTRRMANAKNLPGTPIGERQHIRRSIVQSGDPYSLGPNLSWCEVSRTAMKADPKVEPLSSREVEVLELIAEGLTNQAIGRKLGISVKTVERHRTQIMRKLDAHNVVELIRSGIRFGYITFVD